MSQINVIDYIPQRPPMVMIGELVNSTPKSTTTNLVIEADNVLVHQGQLSEAGLVENIAQTAAFHAGYHRDLSQPVQLGFIGALKDLKVYELPHVGQLLQTTIIITHQIMGATVIEGKAICDGKLMAEVEMKIFIQAAD